MVIDDLVYSKFQITSPFALEIIQCELFQNLKNISQFGLPDKYYHLDGYSRYEHSIGVYILLDKLEASEEEKIAGLLHDISHTAFSHLVDWVIGDHLKEDFQDKRHSAVLNSPELSSIISKFGYKPEAFAEYETYTLLEQPTPFLCADRIDYVFRESDPEIARRCLPALTTNNGLIVFEDPHAALIFAENFLDKQSNHWAGYEGITRYTLFSNLLKLALDDGVITKEDFFGSEQEILATLETANRPEYSRVLEILEKDDLSNLPRSENPVQKKFRYVDPLVLINNEAEVLSSINEDFAKQIIEARKLNELGRRPGVIHF